MRATSNILIRMDYSIQKGKSISNSLVINNLCYCDFPTNNCEYNCNALMKCYRCDHKDDINAFKLCFNQVFEIFTHFCFAQEFSLLLYTHGPRWAPKMLEQEAILVLFFLNIIIIGDVQSTATCKRTKVEEPYYICIDRPNNDFFP